MSNADTAALCRQARLRPAARYILAAATILITSLSFASVAGAAGRRCNFTTTPIARTSHIRLQRAVVCLINQQRRGHGLPSLRADSRLNRSAQGWSDAMVAHRVFTHGADFASRISAVGFDWSNAGENIATGYETAATVVRAWMASPEHCQNILRPDYLYVGTGVVDRPVSGFGSEPGTWTQDFGLLMGQRDPSGNWAPARGCPYRIG